MSFIAGWYLKESNVTPRGRQSSKQMNPVRVEMMGSGFLQGQDEVSEGSETQ